jgi:diguanylate cyclase (GGDEF)-like protein
MPLLVRVMAVMVLAYLLVLLMAPGSEAAAALTSASFAVFPGMAAVACLRPARSMPMEQRRTWRLIAVAMATYACGGLVWFSYGLRDLPVPVPSLGEVGFLGYVIPLTMALLILPSARRSRLARLEVLLDCGVIFSSVLFCVWALVLAPVHAQAVSLPRLQMLTLAAYPAVDVLVIAVALATLMRVRSREVTAWLPLLLGLLLIAAADLIYVTLVAQDAYTAEAPYNIMWALAFLLVALAPHLGGLSQPGGQRLGIGQAMVPYAALAAAVGVALAYGVRPREQLELFVLAMVVSVLAVARQLLVVVTKTRLEDHLEGEVVSATAELRSEREFLAAIVDSLHAGVVACDSDGQVTLFNKATAAFHSDPTLGRFEGWESDLRTATGDAALPAAETPLMRALAGERVEDVEFMIVPPDAPPRALTGSGRALRGPDGVIVGAVLAMHDITDRRRQQHLLERKAAHDELTGLGNRGAFTDELTSRLAAGVPVSVLLLDLDDFKNINDSLGHDAGDQCLIGVARRLVRALPDRGAAYRLGGDEFVMVIDPRVIAPELCAQQVLEAIGEPESVAGTELRTTASIGTATAGGECSTPRELLQAADLAMYVAKSGGKSGVFAYQEHMRGEAQTRLAVETDLRDAIGNDGLHLQYQPIVELASGRMSAAEALVRWSHPERGPVPPVEFIPIAEQCGLIVPLGEWVLQEACAQLLRWDALGGDESFRVTVNVSTRQLERPGLLDVLDRCLGAGVHPSRLVLEVTETALTMDSTAAMETMHAIRARGVQLAVDDFGTGYSSLSRLRSAPVSRIKVDRSFVSEITHADADVPIVEATMAMARGLGMGVIAEGVETQEQLDYLLKQGCPEAQGYLLSRPVDANTLFTCMSAPSWAAVLPATSPDPAPALEFQQLVEQAVDPQVGLEELVRPLLAQLQAATGLALTYMTRVDTVADTQEVTFVQSSAPGPIHQGLVVPWSESLCKRALEQGLRRSSAPAAEYEGHPAPRDLGLEAYIVEPVAAPDGTLYGTLCGASTAACSLTENDSATVRMYARLVEQKLNGRGAAGVGAGRETSGALPAQRRRAEHLWARMSELMLRADEPGSRSQQRANVEAVHRAWETQRGHLAVRRDDRRQRVVIADDQRLLRQVLGAVIGGEDNLALIGESDSAWSTVGVVAAEQPDILLLDFELGDACALDVIEYIRTLSPATRILLHSGRSDVHQLGQQMQVDRVVYKGEDADRLLEALRALVN